MSLLAILISPLLTQTEWGPPPPVAPFNMSYLPTERVIAPIVFPVLGKPRWDDGYNRNRGEHRHTGIDIRAPKMTPILAPISGVLGMKTYSFWIYGNDGWAVLGTHLNDDTPGRRDNRAERDYMFAPNLTPGCQVVAGQLIGYVGDSGDATSPHLHFELFAIDPQNPFATSNSSSGVRTRGQIRNPFPSLKAASHVKSPRIQIPYDSQRPTANEVRFLGCIRRVDEASQSVTLLLVAKQTSKGVATGVVGPRYLRVRMKPSVLQEAGGWSGLRAAPRHRLVSAYGIKAGNDFVATHVRVEVPDDVD